MYVRSQWDLNGKSLSAKKLHGTAVLSMVGQIQRAADN